MDRRHDHVRGGGPRRDEIMVVVYGDYLCPYCRRLRPVLERLRRALGDRLAYVFRQFPNERIHPGAELLSLAAEAAGRQGKFWEMHDGIYMREPPLTEPVVLDIARSIGLDLPRFQRDLKDPNLRRRVEEDLEDGRRTGVTGTPTIFVDGQRYDGAWDFYSMLEGLERPVGARVQRTARTFANLPTSAGLVLLIAAALALICANTSLAPAYQALVNADFRIGPGANALSLTVAEWCSEGLLAIFFLIVGLEIRREMTAGSLSDPRAAVAPLLAAIGGVLAPAAIYLALNRGPTAAGWATPADTGLPFVLAVLAIFGARASAGLKVFVASYAVVGDVLTILILAVFFPRTIHAEWLVASVVAVAAMLMLNRWRVYAGWTYLAAAASLWMCLHLAGVSGALSGVALAAALPTRPPPETGPLVAQAANALAELDHAQKAEERDGDQGARIDLEQVWEWASRNLSATAARLLSPAERFERGLAPWSTYLVLPLFAFTAAGVPLTADFSAPAAGGVFWGVVLGMAIGKPIGIGVATWAAVKARIALFPPDAALRAFLGAACLCGMGDPVSLLVADQAFGGGAYGGIAKVGILVGSVLAAVLGSLALATASPPVTASAT